MAHLPRVNRHEEPVVAAWAPRGEELGVPGDGLRGLEGQIASRRSTDPGDGSFRSLGEPLCFGSAAICGVFGLGAGVGIGERPTDQPWSSRNAERSFGSSATPARADTPASQSSRHSHSGVRADARGARRERHASSDAEEKRRFVDGGWRPLLRPRAQVEAVHEPPVVGDPVATVAEHVGEKRRDAPATPGARAVAMPRRPPASARPRRGDRAFPSGAVARIEHERVVVALASASASSGSARGRHVECLEEAQERLFPPRGGRGSPMWRFVTIAAADRGCAKTSRGAHRWDWRSVTRLLAAKASSRARCVPVRRERQPAVIGAEPPIGGSCETPPMVATCLISESLGKRSRAASAFPASWTNTTRRSAA